MPNKLSWAGFGAMGVALIATNFVHVDPHSSVSVLTCLGAAATAIAGLCFHPPWAPTATNNQNQANQNANH